jgi:hypothetical protein
VCKDPAAPLGTDEEGASAATSSARGFRACARGERGRKGTVTVPFSL